MIGKRFLCLILQFSICCITEAQHKTDSADVFNLMFFGGDTLYINVQYMECGEFGGHIEKSKIYSAGNSFYITYQKFSVNCSGIKENYGRPVQTLHETNTQKLTGQQQLLLLGYFQQLLACQFTDFNLMHAGYTFNISMLNHSLNIHLYSLNNKLLHQYEKLIQTILGLPTPGQL